MTKKLTIALLLLIFNYSGFSQTYFDLSTDQNYKCGWDNSMPMTTDLKQLKKIDQETLSKIFDTISNHSNIEFNYPQGGCQHRAHVMSLLLSKHKIEHTKIWLFAPVDLYMDRKEVLTIADKNQLAFNNTINWNYHVAPVVLATNEATGKTDTLIIDPAIERNRPLKFQEWMSKIGNSKISNYTFLNPSQYFFYVKPKPDGTLSNVISGCFYLYQGFTKDNFTIEKGMALNDMSIVIYNKYIKPLQNSSSDPTKLNELKLIFGNVSTSEFIFASNGNITNPQVQKALQNSSTIVNEAKEVFKDRLGFWKTEIQKLSIN